MPYADDIYVEQADSVYTAADWRIAVDNEQPGGEEFSLSSSGATIVVHVSWKKVRSFLRYVLGWSYADRAYPYRLRREMPIYHPRFAWLRASSVQLRGLAPDAMGTSGTSRPGAYSTALRDAAYKLVEATIRFNDPPWTYLGDDSVPSYSAEPQRYTYFDPVPSVEVISAEGLNNIKFANGPSAGIAIPAPFGTLMSKTLKTLHWMQVPHEYISGNDVLQFSPANINKVVGRVNSDVFLGHPPGTLLLQAPQYERFRFPIQTAGGIYNYFGWNIKFPMQFFDPQRGYDIGTIAGNAITLPTLPTSPSGLTYTYLAGQPLTLCTALAADGAPSGTVYSTTVSSLSGTTLNVVSGGGLAGSVYVFNDAYRGHQLLPRRADLKWYGAVREDGKSKLYPEAAYATIFKHVGNPVN